MSHRVMRRIIPSLLLAAAAAVPLTALAQDAAADTATRYVQSDAAPLAAEPGGDPFANLYVTTELEVLEQADGASRVRVEGFARPGEAGVAEVFTDDTNATRVADVSDASAVETVAEHGDWHEVALEGWVADDALADDLDPMFEEAAAIYEANCTRCHTGYAQPADVLRRTLPNARVERVVHNMARGTDVTDEQVNLIIQWFQKHPDDLASD